MSALGAVLRRRIGAVALATITVASLATACTGDDTKDATRALESWLAEWKSGSIPGHDEQYQELVGGLGERTPELQAGDVTVEGDRASAPVDVTWTFAADTPWQYTTTVELVRADDTWRVQWSPQTVHPELADGEQLSVEREWRPRAPILDGDGEAITKARGVVVIGVQPSLVKSAERLARKLGAALKPEGVDTSELPDRIREADPGAFVDVVTVRRSRYQELKPQIYDLPGTVFLSRGQVLAPTREFARALLGTVGPVTKEDMDAAPGMFEVGDNKGHNGLQEQYDERLRGSPSIVVTAESGEDKSRTVFSMDGTRGKPLRTTIDRDVQYAADAAVRDSAKSAAVVAIRVSDGATVAVANSSSAGAYNVAMRGQVPPGSTFKVVSALNLLGSGVVTLDGSVRCPATMRVGGREFKNAWDGGIANATFRDAFAQSCNTAFALLAPKLGPSGLAETADQLGIGREWDLGAPVDSGSVATNVEPVQQAAASFGQGKTVVSPMAMAAATAGVARGQWQQPALVTKPSPSEPAPDGPKLDADATKALRTAMRAVVTEGSATQLASIRGGDVFGKTGTAEYGTESPPRSHSWFTGWQGDIAFAVFVEDGGNDGSKALAVTERFLNRLNS